MNKTMSKTVSQMHNKSTKSQLFRVIPPVIGGPEQGRCTQFHVEVAAGPCTQET